MARLVAAWCGFWALLGGVFYLADRRGVALCTAVRHVGRMDTRPGRAAVVTCLHLGAMVLGRHLCKPFRTPTQGA